MPESVTITAAGLYLDGKLIGHVHEDEAREIMAFSRFLKLGEPAPLPGTKSDFLQRHRGWLPYVLGQFFCLGGPGEPVAPLAPPKGYDDVPFTAWTLPG